MFLQKGDQAHADEVYTTVLCPRSKQDTNMFLQKGELAQNDEVFTTFVEPQFKQNTNMTLTIYTTPELGAQYTKDKQWKMNVRKNGE